MKRTSLPQNLIAATAVAVSIALTSAPALHGQCVSGLGVTTLQAATQNFGKSGTSLDTTTIVEAGGTFSPQQFPAVLSAVFDKTGLYALVSTGEVFRLFFSGTTPGVYEVQYAPDQLYAPAGTTSLIEAGDTVWAISNNQIYNAFAAKGSAPVAGVRGTIGGATSDGTYAWFSTSIGNLMKINLATSKYVGTVNISSAPLGPMSFDGDHLWVAQGGTLLEVDPASGSVLASVELGGAISSVIYDGIYLWVGNSAKADLIKFDPAKMQQVGTVTPGGSGYGALTFDGATVSAYSFSSPVVNKARACDMHEYPSTTLPTTPTLVVFDGAHTWAFSSYPATQGAMGWPFSGAISIR